MYATQGEKDTFEFGAEIGRHLTGGDSVLLYGDLGTGKSVMARGIASALGVTDVMASPTFTIMQPYAGKLPVYHFDLYRIEDPDEFYEAGLNDFLFSDGVSLVEWPEQADLPELKGVAVRIERTEDFDKRKIELEFTDIGSRKADIEKSLEHWRL